MKIMSNDMDPSVGVIETHLISVINFVGVPNSLPVLHSTFLLTESGAFFKSINSYVLPDCTPIFFHCLDASRITDL
jgi:hypothetical protein